MQTETPLGADGTGSYTKILQGPNEAYVEFLTRLGVAISHNVVREETRVQLEKLLAYENENQECQRAIASIRETGNVIDYLKACRNLGSETQKMQMLAEAMAAAFKMTSLAPHERLPEILVVPREKTPTGAAARGNP